MARDILLVLNDIMKNNVVSSDMLQQAHPFVLPMSYFSIDSQYGKRKDHPERERKISPKDQKGDGCRATNTYPTKKHKMRRQTEYCSAFLP
jgi:hypothetical protein